MSNQARRTGRIDRMVSLLNAVRAIDMDVDGITMSLGCKGTINFKLTFGSPNISPAQTRANEIKQTVNGICNRSGVQCLKWLVNHTEQKPKAGNEMRTELTTTITEIKN